MLALASNRGLAFLEFTTRARMSRVAHRLARWFMPHEIRDGWSPPTRDAETWLDAYFAGDMVGFPSLDLRGTTFERRVWTALAAIPPGATATYGGVAATLGHTSKARAVGAAGGANPVAIIVPCHRVIGSSGSLTGYGGGLDSKRWLLQHESRWATQDMSRT